MVEVEDLGPLADGPGVAGDHRGAVEGLDGLGPQAHARCGGRHSARGPNRSTGARRPGSWCRPGGCSSWAGVEGLVGQRPQLG